MCRALGLAAGAALGCERARPSVPPAGAAARTPASACGGAAGPRLSDLGVDPVVIGASARGIRARCPDARDTALVDSTWDDTDRRIRVDTTPGLVVAVGGAPVVARLGADGTVGTVHVRDARPRTADGFGVGARIATLRRVAGVAVTFGEDGEASALTVPSHCGLAFRLSGGEPPTDLVSYNTATAADLRHWPDTIRVTAVDVYGPNACR